MQKIDLTQLEKQSAKPKLFAKDNGNFWADSYISEHLLNAHLDNETEEGSRNYKTISDTVNFICQTTNIPPNSTVLDLGCGPGLYSEQFTNKGFTVTGIDISQNSINYAKEQAAINQQPIHYICKNYLEIDYENQFDVITLIYGDLCVLSHEERHLLLQKVYRALKPNGYLVFDVFTKNYIPKNTPKESWYISTEDGFWAEQPHLVLESHHRYKKEKVYLDKYTLLFENGIIRTHHIWKHYFSLKRVNLMLEEAKFKAIYIGSDLQGTPCQKSDKWIGVIAQKL